MILHLLASPIALALCFFQDDATLPPVGASGGELMEMVRNSGSVAFAVLIILLIASICSWAIMISKWRRFGRARRQSQGFLRAFRKSGRLSEIASIAGSFKPSPLVSVFNEINDEYQRQSGGRGTPRNPAALERAAQTASSEALTAMETHMTWLATIANGATFVGLFGTVMGIIDAFHGLGTAGAATLRAVAPGISEALITTAAGLAVAIPALVGYNQLTAQLRDFASRMDDFGRELLNAIENAALLTPQPPRPAARRPRPAPPEGLLAMAFSTRNGGQTRTQTALADINITPLVDVVLVLLIIFMITAPVLQSGIDVSVPHTRSVNQLTEERIVVTIDKNQNVFLQAGGADRPINLSDLTANLRSTGRGDPAKRIIYLRADEKVPFGAFASVMDAVKRAGITNISIVTQPLESTPSADTASK